MITMPEFYTVVFYKVVAKGVHCMIRNTVRKRDCSVLSNSLATLGVVWLQ